MRTDSGVGRKPGFEVVRTMGLALPEVEEGTVYGSPALKIQERCLPVWRFTGRPKHAGRPLDFDQRNELIAADPKTYYLTDHYVSYPCVLVRLPRIQKDALGDPLLMGYQFGAT